MRKMIVIEPEKCSGCRICEQICSLTTNRVGGSSKSAIRILRWQMKGADIPVVCLQCEDPVCSNVCPLRALVKDANSGIIKLDEEACIGCRLCSFACPIGAISVDLDKGIAVKCDQCDGDPQCVKYCSSEALRYLDYDKAVDALKRSKAHKILEIIAPTSSVRVG